MNYDQQSFFKHYEKNLDEIIDLQDLVIQIDDDKPPPTMSQIPPQFLSSRKEFLKLFSSIITGIYSKQKYENFKKYFQLLDELLPIIKKYLSSEDLFYMVILDNIRFYFYQKGLITIETIIQKTQIRSERSYVFAPEIFEYSKTIFDKIFASKEAFLKDVNKKSIESFVEYRNKWMNEEPVCIAIRSDDADKLREIISKNNLSYDYVIPCCQYEIVTQLLNKKKLTLINYSAFYGSTNCFKYLLLNNSAISEETMEFAVYGGNYEIIHILESKKCPTSKALEASIRLHNNELYEYFTSSLDIPHNNSSIIRSVTNYNILVLKDVLSDENIYNSFFTFDDAQGSDPFGVCLSQNFPDLAEMFVNIKDFDINKIQPCSYSYLMEACYSGDIDIVKFVLDNGFTNINYVSNDSILMFFLITQL